MRRPDSHEDFAARLLTLAPEVVYTGGHHARDYSIAIWIGRLYGYSYPDIHQAWGNSQGLIGYKVTFTRNDDPEARRIAAWMRNPSGDPTLKPPITWRMDRGFSGFHPPGWHPAVRMVITREIEMELRQFDQYVTHTLDLGWFDGLPRKPQPLPPGPIPPPPPPPPPPATIAYPDEEERP
ncbi:hypothetical protein ABH940_000842 [Streptacidiphilus sp. BW17]|uniref:hypothetical protein n=1 Tax=Streptacidiphilus sp. BW17 TaxID=3156274 RepID=UPI003516A09A